MAKKRMFEEVLREESRTTFRINTGTIPPGEVEAFLAKIISEYKKSPITDVSKNLYTRTLITERMKKYKIYEPLTMIADYFIPTR